MNTTLASICTASVLLVSAGCERSSAAAAAPPPPMVSVATVIQRDVPIDAEWVATLDGFVNARIQPQVTGYVVRQLYREGAAVREGEVLFEIDPRPFQALVDVARGQLEQAKAEQARAAQDVERDRPLAAQKAIPQSQFDTEVQALAAAQAAVQAAGAQVETAELNLGFSKVRSLVSGLAGIATVQVGNLVGPDTVLTTVSQVEPIKAFFSIAEPDYLRAPGELVGRGRRHGPTKDTAPFELILTNGSVHPYRGDFFAVDRAVDPETGAITVVATFSNPGAVLRPGQFGRVRAQIEMLEDALVVPQRSVSELQGGNQVMVVSAQNMATVRPVTVGPRTGADWVIAKGLQPGERVIVDGLQKVRDGMSVTPQPAQSARRGDR